MRRLAAWPPWLATLAMAVVLAVWGTWPLAADLKHRVFDPRHGPGMLSWSLGSDVYLTIWILAWDTHAVLTHPFSLFDANIFHPAHGTLASTESMLGGLPVYLPIALITGDPVLSHQASLVLTFVLAFMSAAVVVRDWTACWPAALLAGALYSFSAHRVAGLAGVHSLGDYYLPLIPYFMRPALRTGSFSPLVGLFVVLVLVSLHSFYLAYAAFIAAAMLFGTAVVFDADSRRGAAKTAVAAALAAGAVGVVAIPYLSARHVGTLAPPSDEWLALNGSTVTETGATAALLISVATAVFLRRGLRRSVGSTWIAALVCVAVVGHAVAIGPQIRIGGHSYPGPYRLLVAMLPGASLLRVPGRFNWLSVMGLSLLAGIGTAGLYQSVPVHRLRSFAALVVAIGASVLVVKSGVPRTLDTMPVVTREVLPPAYEWLASSPPGPLLELPFRDFHLFPFEREEEARRMYLSVYHWHPLLNGYSGYTPPGYEVVSALARVLPDARAVSLLARTTGVRYVLLHRRELSPGDWRRWRPALRAFRVAYVAGPDVVLALRTPPPADLVNALESVDGTKGGTLLGTPLRALDVAERNGALSLARAPRAAYAGLAFPVDIVIRNDGSEVWPTLAARDDHVVTVAYRWEDMDGRVLGVAATDNRIPYDLAPGESVRMRVAVVAAGVAGPRTLILGVAQDGAWFPGTTVAVPIAIESASPMPDAAT